MTRAELSRERRIFASSKVMALDGRSFENVSSSPRYLRPTALSFCPWSTFTILTIVSAFWKDQSDYGRKVAAGHQFIIRRVLSWSAELLGQTPECLRRWQLGMKAARLSLIGCSEVFAIVKGNLQGDFLAEEICSLFMTYQMIYATYFMSKFWNAFRNDQQVLMKCYQNNLEGNAKCIEFAGHEDLWKADRQAWQRAFPRLLSAPWSATSRVLSAGQVDSVLYGLIPENLSPRFLNSPILPPGLADFISLIEQITGLSGVHSVTLCRHFTGANHHLVRFHGHSAAPEADPAPAADHSIRPGIIGLAITCPLQPHRLSHVQLGAAMERRPPTALSSRLFR